MCFNHKISACMAGVIFVLLFLIGILLSEHKLLWIDECFTQHVSVQKPTYKDILTSNIPDGNRCPLFYLIQKINSDIFAFHYPDRESQGSADLIDARSQIIIRIPSNICMSLALAGIFYFLTRYYSIFLGIYALIIALISPMVWFYWVEARPYSLWFLLTTAQLLLFCSTILSPKIKVSRYVYLTHLLLILTTPGSIIQVLIISIMLLVNGKYTKRQMLLSFVLPACVFLIYYFFVPIYRIKTFFILNILFAVVMPERLIVYMLYVLAAWGLPKRIKESSSNTFFLPIFLLFLLSVVAMLISHLFTKNFQFGLFNRYLIYMVPADILMFSFASFDMWQWSRKNRWVCLNLIILLTGLIIIRGLLTYRDILASALYLHSPV